MCLWRWLQCPLGTAQKQNQMQTPVSRRTEESGGSVTDRNNWARNGLTWPAPGKQTTQQIYQVWGRRQAHSLQYEWMYSAGLLPTRTTEFLWVDSTQLRAYLQRYHLLARDSFICKLHMAQRGTSKYYQDNWYSNWGAIKTILSVKAKINKYFLFFFFWTIACSNGNRSLKINIYCFVTIQML